MREGAYVFRFGSNQTIRIYYLRHRFELEVDTNIVLNQTKIISAGTLSSKASPIELDFPNFRYCMNYLFKEFKNDTDSIKQYIKCEGLKIPDRLNTRFTYEDQDEALNTLPCHWDWKPKLNVFYVSLVENETVAREEDVVVNRLENNLRYIPALTCEIKNFMFFDESLSIKKSIKFAIPFNISDPIEPAYGKSLLHPQKVFTSPWTGFFAIPPVVVMFAAYCCYRRYV